ncbi:MAG: HEAT repeat domain-containing protein [Deltaproteobacteria bacterium]|nr:HEAT repeat domain-containing protein [Deltaproteobacteria bacterium]
MTIKLPKKILQELDELAEGLIKEQAEEREKILGKLIRYEQSGKVPLPAILVMADAEVLPISLYAIGALGRNGEPQAVDKLVALLEKNRNESALLLETIVDALGEAGSARGAPSLLGLLGLRPIPTGWRALLDRLLANFRKSGGQEPQPEQQNPLLRLPVIRALEKIADPGSTAQLGVFLDDPDPLVRWHTMRGIAKCGLTSFNDRLRRMAEQDDNEIVRDMAQIALDGMGSSQGTPGN